MADATVSVRPSIPKNRHFLARRSSLWFPVRQPLRRGARRSASRLARLIPEEAPQKLFGAHGRQGSFSCSSRAGSPKASSEARRPQGRLAPPEDVVSGVGATPPGGSRQASLGVAIVVVEVLVAQRQAEDPLRDQSLQRVDGQKQAAAVAEASREPAVNPMALPVSPSNSAPGVRRNHSAIEISRHTPPANPSKIHLRWATPRQHRGAPANLA